MAEEDSNHPYLSRKKVDNQQIEDKLKPRFECPICLSWLQDPVLTSCGHKFCYNCIHSWLKREETRCPIDGQHLEEEKDIFRDRYTSREISQQQISCPHKYLGCPVILSPLRLQSHTMECVYKDSSPENNICHIDNHEFNAAERKDYCSMATGENISNCLLEKDKLSSIQTSGNEKYDSYLKSTPSNSSSQSFKVDFENVTDWKKLIKNLYERIVTLEQLNQELHITIANQCSGIESIQKSIKMREICSKNSSGIYIWKIMSFQKKLKEMQSSPSTMFYSPEFFSHPNGYKMCARVNISSKNSQFLSIVIHMMKSENDDYLDWPFNGTISFILVHQLNSEQSIREETYTKPNLEAFKKPVGEINRRSFGYTEFVSLNDLSNYLYDNSLVFRIEVTKTKILVK